MASKLYKLGDDGKVIEQMVEAIYVDAELKAGWVANPNDLAKPKKARKAKSNENKD